MDYRVIKENDMFLLTDFAGDVPEEQMHLVRRTVRPRQPDHRDAAFAHPTGGGQRHTVYDGALSGRESRSLAGRTARQNHARTAKRRIGQYEPDPLRAVFRFHRCDAPFSGSVWRICEMDRRSGYDAGAYAECLARVGMDRPLRTAQRRPLHVLFQGGIQGDRQSGLEGLRGFRRAQERGIRKAPIALVEVQGYVYQAKTVLTDLCLTLPEETEYDWHSLAGRLSAEAEQLRKEFEADFWMEEEQFYAMALDYEGKQVQAITSNPGHALMSGLYAPERAAAVARKLVSPGIFSGYGIRTMAEGNKGYNPMSYHNGSIWPHDNSMCLMGLSAQGYREEAAL